MALPCEPSGGALDLRIDDLTGVVMQNDHHADPSDELVMVWKPGFQSGQGVFIGWGTSAHIFDGIIKSGDQLFHHNNKVVKQVCGGLFKKGCRYELTDNDGSADELKRFVFLPEGTALPCDPSDPSVVV